jgi:hypothetical protein
VGFLNESKKMLSIPWDLTDIIIRRLLAAPFRELNWALMRTFSEPMYFVQTATGIFESNLAAYALFSLTLVSKEWSLAVTRFDAVWPLLYALHATGKERLAEDLFSLRWRTCLYCFVWSDYWLEQARIAARSTGFFVHPRSEVANVRGVLYQCRQRSEREAGLAACDESERLWRLYVRQNKSCPGGRLPEEFDWQKILKI